MPVKLKDLDVIEKKKIQLQKSVKHLKIKSPKNLESKSPVKVKQKKLLEEKVKVS